MRAKHDRRDDLGVGEAFKPHEGDESQKTRAVGYLMYVVW